MCEGGYAVHACCIGHDHAHIVVGRHERTIERIAGHLKSKASMSTRAADCHPFATYARNDQVSSPWAEGCWSVFIDNPAHARSAIDYVKRHPMKEGLPAQQWAFVTRLPDAPV